MASSAANVDVGVTGVVSVGPTSTTAPTSSISTIAGFTDVGFCTDDGVEISQPDAGDKTVIKAWQNGATVRTIRSLTDDNPQLIVTFLETNISSVQTYFDAVAVQTATDGQITVSTLAIPSHKSYVVDVVDGATLLRTYVPNGLIVSRGSIKFANTEAIGYQVTIDCEYSTTATYNLRSWFSQLHS